MDAVNEWDGEERASGDVGPAGPPLILWERDAATEGDVGENACVVGGRDGEVPFSCKGEGRCSLACACAVCAGDPGCPEERGMVVRMLLALPASEAGRAGDPR